MRNEESINELIRHKQEMQNDFGWNTTLQTALDAAIAALKTEPCEDCVSREAVDILVDELARAISDERCCISRGRSTAAIMQDILDLPPVTPKQRWIPVDYDKYPETYPKAFQEVWIIDAYGEVYHRAYDGTRSVKAWMPYIIPEPYKEGESE